MFNGELSTSEYGGRVSVRYGGRVSVRLRGGLDVADAVSVAASLAATAAGHPKVIIDLTGQEFIDSSGVAAAAARIRRRDGDSLIAAGSLT